MTTYKIIRFFEDGHREQPPNLPNKLTMEEAQAYCSRDDTHGQGWMDMYTENKAPRYGLRENITDALVIAYYNGE